MEISKPYVTEISDILDRYISEKVLGEEIFIPLRKIVTEITNLDSEAYENLHKDYLKKSKGKVVSNFLFFHGVRNLKLTALKVIESFEQAKIKMMNPKVAKNLKQFINPFLKFLFFLKTVKEKSFFNMEDLSEEIEKFREVANKSSFLCTTDDELKYDEITHKDFRELIDSIRETSTKGVI